MTPSDQLTELAFSLALKDLENYLPSIHQHEGSALDPISLDAFIINDQHTQGLPVIHGDEKLSFRLKDKTNDMIKKDVFVNLEYIKIQNRNSILKSIMSEDHWRTYFEWNAEISPDDTIVAPDGALYIKSKDGETASIQVNANDTWEEIIIGYSVVFSLNIPNKDFYCLCRIDPFAKVRSNPKP